MVTDVFTAQEFIDAITERRQFIRIRSDLDFTDIAPTGIRRSLLPSQFYYIDNYGGHIDGNYHRITSDGGRFLASAEYHFFNFFSGTIRRVIFSMNDSFNSVARWANDAVIEDIIFEDCIDSGIQSDTEADILDHEPARESSAAGGRITFLNCRASTSSTLFARNMLTKIITKNITREIST